MKTSTGHSCRTVQGHEVGRGAEQTDDLVRRAGGAGTKEPADCRTLRLRNHSGGEPLGNVL